MRARLVASLLTGIVVGILGACGGAPPRGPAWPDPAERRDPEAEDGGESLAPQASSSLEGDDDDDDEEIDLDGLLDGDGALDDELKDFLYDEGEAASDGEPPSLGELDPADGG